MLVIQLVYQQVENYIVYPIVYRRAVELSAVHDDRRGADRRLAARRRRRDPRRAVRGRDQDRACARPARPRRARMAALRAEELREQVPV